MFGKKKTVTIKSGVKATAEQVDDWLERLDAYGKQVEAQRDEALRETTLLQRRLDAANAKLADYGHTPGY